MPQLEQSASNIIAKYQARTCKATFTTPTTPGSLIVVILVTAGALPVGLVGPAGFTLVRSSGLRDIEVGVWYRQNAPATTSVSLGFQGLTQRSMQVRAMEYSGVAQSNALDKVTIASGDSTRPFTGSTGTTAQADSLVIGVVANQYGSTTQGGFIGGLARLAESVSPQYYSGKSNADWERARVTVHQAITTAVANFSLTSLLSASRRWIGFLITFRGATTGPAKLTSTTAPPLLTTSGTGVLTVFGPLRSVNLTSNGPMLTTTGVRARIGPFNYQYLLGGWNGLLIGDDTPYRVESHDGLEGWELRTSDDDLPRGDGALRGSDLQSARQVMFKLKVGGEQVEVEAAMDALFRALIPQRDADWELIWRHPGRPLRLLRCRPTSLIRGLSWRETIVNNQTFVLRAADPRHYSASLHEVKVPVSVGGRSDEAVEVGAVNFGNGPAYPTIRVTTTVPVTRIDLVNQSTDVAFDIRSNLLPGSTLVGDMEARATGAPRSVVTIDGKSTYGAWQHPRQTFAINPGTNQLAVFTEPPNAPVTVTVTYPDTWSG